MSPEISTLFNYIYRELNDIKRLIKETKPKTTNEIRTSALRRISDAIGYIDAKRGLELNHLERGHSSEHYKTLEQIKKILLSREEDIWK